ncbi:hypothetical protein EV44_g3805 [Erysiphe necator]|uniref:Uncharacterized protein n=1 Tax=Uncinula necator TaxID=52586 RepID=A0A0B1NZX2_UNCNE|nr:hypothetical protein EV44_g3805 [Erysiphe necator]
MDTIGASGGGYDIYQGSNLLYTGLAPLGSSAEAHDADLAVAVSGVKAALETVDASFFRKHPRVPRQ